MHTEVAKDFFSYSSETFFNCHPNTFDQTKILMDTVSKICKLA